MSATHTSALPDYAPVPQSAVHPALNEHGYQVERPEQNVHWITDAPYRSAFVTDSVGVVLLDAAPTIGNKIWRPVHETDRDLDSTTAHDHCPNRQSLRASS